ncbi:MULTISPECIES: hypothetical protein [Gordonia]|uniref:Oxidoreductase N-terminal domain-containing protein n=1 Tax=Gordonia hongkongensis TaxID=1701090 RepID=A0ABT6BPA0_9ACTN|nr:MULTISPECIES: hypothetical protein [Gordonia]MDF6099565.1 hypothetical protein [Gordonia hongkongensis]MDT0223384.1 hypothetical protein [Gordonia sp. AC31]OCH82751.1 hypothetical protein A9310_12030 [Gordonia sp. UCD-TK1]
MTSGVATTTRTVFLRKRPDDGVPRPENFEVRETEVGPLRGDQILVENRYMSVDPSMRGRLGTSE